MAKIKGILFDLGNTLLDFGPVDVLAAFKAGANLAYAFLQRLGQPVPKFARFYRRQMWALRWEYLKSRMTGREFNSLDVLGRMSRRMGQSLAAGQLADLAWQWYQPLSTHATVEGGLPEMLWEFQRRGLRLGVISNTFLPGVVLDRHMENLGLLGFFEVRVYSCDVRYRKPHRRIFQIALDRLGLPAGAVIFVGDSHAADVAGANRAGLISVLKDPTGGRRWHGAAPLHRIASLRQLPQIVAAYNGA